MSQEREMPSGSVHEERNPYGEQDSWGNDIAALRRNLKLTPLERLQRAEAGAKGILELRRAIKRPS